MLQTFNEKNRAKELHYFGQDNLIKAEACGPLTDKRYLEARERKSLVEGFQDELARVLADPMTRTAWVRSRYTPVVKLGRLPLEDGPSGSRKFGIRLAGSIGRGLKP